MISENGRGDTKCCVIKERHTDTEIWAVQERKKSKAQTVLKIFWVVASVCEDHLIKTLSGK